jgi:hypothetical protein
MEQCYDEEDSRRYLCELLVHTFPNGESLENIQHVITDTLCEVQRQASSPPDLDRFVQNMARGQGYGKRGTQLDLADDGMLLSSSKK